MKTLSFYEKEPVLRKRGFAYAKTFKEKVFFIYYFYISLIAGKEMAEKKESLIKNGRN